MPKEQLQVTKVIETHAFGNFVPPNARYLILGSFTAKKNEGDDYYDWFYTTKRNQFWPILEEVYGLKLESKKAKQDLFTRQVIAIADIILQCERRDGTSADNNLINIVYNTIAIQEILRKSKIEKIFFSSRFVEKEFKKRFKNLIEEHPHTELITLPSPSPRYAAMRKEEKVRQYKKLLPLE